MFVSFCHLLLDRWLLGNDAVASQKHLYRGREGSFFTRLGVMLDSMFIEQTGEGTGSYNCTTSSSNCRSGGQPIVLGQPGFSRVGASPGETHWSNWKV